jgi:riboflavin synthase
MPETLSRTTLGSLRPGDPVNLEAAMRHDGRVGGHLVTGHVDAVGRVLDTRTDGNAMWVTVSAPQPLAALLVEKGCVAVDGISLTVVDAGSDYFTVSLIPTTLALTTLGIKQAGDPVNLEVDVLAKYVERLLGADRAEAAQ